MKDRLNRYKWMAYLAVIAFYGGLMTLAHIGRNRQPQPEQSAQPMTGQQDTLLQDIHTIIDWQPQLDDDKAGTPVNRPSRYTAPSMDGLQGVDRPQDIAYLLRSTLFADFSKRFNADPGELERLKAVDFTSAGTLPERVGCILSLVNEADVTDNATLLQFARDLVRDSLYIDRSGGTNFAAVATFEYAGRDSTAFPVRLTFRKGVAEGANVWYMTAAESPRFTCGDPDKPYYMDATENEFRFIGMTRHPGHSAQSLAGPDFAPDPRTAFLSLVSAGAIAYRRTVDVSYVIWLGDYTLYVEHVESWVHKRSGLLITRLMKADTLLYENRPH